MIKRSLRARAGRRFGLLAWVVALSLLEAATGSAHELISTKLTWTEHVSRIVAGRCVGCHREGGSAPMALETYRQVRPWAKAIKQEVLSRRMPPWGPVKGYGSFRDDRGLTQHEIAVLSSWVEGGSPQGDPELLGDPAPQLGRPAEIDRSSTTAIAVQEIVKLTEDVIALGIRPDSAVEMQVRARRPDGSVEPLLWFRPTAPIQTFWFREELLLPRGSKLRIDGPKEASATLLVRLRR